MRYLGLNIWKILEYWFRCEYGTWKYTFKHIWTRGSDFARTRQLRDSKKGRQAFVFANGPSLNSLDPHKIVLLQKQGFDILGTNSYISSEFGEIARPDLFLLSDPAHFDRRLPDRELMHLSEAERIKRQKTYSEHCETIWSRLEKTGIPLFVPAQHFELTPVSTKYVFADSVSIFRPNVADILKPLGLMAMTAYKALAVAIFLGYDRVYIGGFDNTFFKSIQSDADNNLYYTYKHASGGEGRYKAVGGWLEGRNVGHILWTQHFMFTHLEKFRGYEIVNLDPEGLITTFTKHHSLDVYKEKQADLS